MVGVGEAATSAAVIPSTARDVLNHIGSLLFLFLSQHRELEEGLARSLTELGRRHFTVNARLRLLGAVPKAGASIRPRVASPSFDIGAVPDPQSDAGHLESDPEETPRLLVETRKMR
jgi:hypothetical protein